MYNLDLKFEALTQRKTFLTVIIGDCNAKFICVLQIKTQLKRQN